MLEEKALVVDWVTFNQNESRRDQWQAFMNVPAWAFKSQIR